MARPKGIGQRVPLVSLFFVGVSLIAYGWPQLADLLVYDREAILGGDFWRLSTAPFVHFSASHICWDLVVFGAAGWAIEAAGYRGFWFVCAIAAIIPGLTFMLASPELARYGGLSGLATGAVAYLCLCKTQETGGSRIIWLAILALMGVKTIVEIVTNTPIFVLTDSMPFRVLPSVHAFGCAGALAALIWIWPNKPLHTDAAGPHR
ncbi:MAG: rhombosortase [Anaerolineales bacterium]|nr:rhombosortase [Anaerolineales bacterium]